MITEIDFKLINLPDSLASVLLDVHDYLMDDLSNDFLLNGEAAGCSEEHMKQQLELWRKFVYHCHIQIEGED